MSVKTVRFNKKEEALLKKMLRHYGSDFSSCIKKMICEKMEDLHDMEAVHRIKEGKREDYWPAAHIDQLFK